MGATRTTPIVSLEALYAGLAGRPWPEAVAGAIRSLLAEDLSRKELRLLDRAAQAGSGYSYLATTFDPVVTTGRPAHVLGSRSSTRSIRRRSSTPSCRARCSGSWPPTWPRGIA